MNAWSEAIEYMKNPKKDSGEKTWLVHILRNYTTPWGCICSTEEMNRIVRNKGRDRITVEYLGEQEGEQKE